MPKPIVVMYIPDNGAFDHYGRDVPDRLMQILNGNYGQPEVDRPILPCEYWSDYYWFVFVKGEIREPQLEVFYEKNFTPIKFEDLKKFIEEILKPKESEND